MAQYFQIHPETPQGRLIHQAVRIIRDGGVVVYPSDTTYALGCQIGDKGALERVCQIRQLGPKHHFAIICRDLSALSRYASLDTPAYRLLRALTPGPYTFVLPASRELPRRLMHAKRKTIGLRVPDHRILQMLLEELGEPLLTTTLRLPGDEYPLQDPQDIRQRLERSVDLIIDGGFGGLESTTLVSLLDGETVVLREGKGSLAPFA